MCNIVETTALPNDGIDSRRTVFVCMTQFSKFTTVPVVVQQVLFGELVLAELLLTSGTVTTSLKDHSSATNKSA